jgi:hypothetical protein
MIPDLHSARKPLLSLRSSPTTAAETDLSPGSPMTQVVLDTISIRDFADYQNHLFAIREVNESRFKYELGLLSGADETVTPGFCYVCQHQVDFLIDFKHAGEHYEGNIRIPNWRERLVCPDCQLNNRTRACIHFLNESLLSKRYDSIYVTEQVTPLYTSLANCFPKLIGSEYLGDRIPYGSINEQGIRNESITRLSFKNDSFDFILSFDVFEHVPEYSKALKECLRCLKSGGILLFTVPFISAIEDNLVRATLGAGGELVHLLEPEYHGDPVNDEGCLCFYHFGWNLLEEMRAAGFAKVNAHLYWSKQYGYLGGEQLLFAATK